MFSSPSPVATLRRELRRWDLVAIGVNQVLGAAIFLVPSAIAARLGNWSPAAFLLVGGASFLIALCFAEVGSRFANTGGAYLYARTAFGRFAGFEVGWMQWFTRVSSQATVVTGITLSLAFYWPAAGRAGLRAALIIAITLLFAWIHACGIRQSAWTINACTIGKLLPIAIFLAVGFLRIDWRLLAPLPSLTTGQAFAGTLLLFYTFGGFEVVPIIAGETKSPARDVPFALIWSVAVITLVMTLVEIVTMTTLPGIAKSTTPVADSAYLIMGAGGAALISVGAILSMLGHNAGSSLSASRILYAMAENGDLPTVFARVHPVHQTPTAAIWFSAAVVVVLAVSGSFVTLAAVSTVARLVVYLGVTSSAMALRNARFTGRVNAAAFLIPLGPTVPVLASVLAAVTLAGATRTELLSGVVALAGGAALFLPQAVLRNRKDVSETPE